MSGVHLRELDSADLVDVLHYIFEEDMDAFSAEQVEAKDGYRTALYENLYGIRYNYRKTSSKSSANNFVDLDDPLDDLEEDISTPKEIPAYKKPPKPYVPPTNFNPDLVNPFAASKLDAPLN